MGATDRLCSGRAGEDPLCRMASSLEPWAGGGSAGAPAPLQSPSAPAAPLETEVVCAWCGVSGGFAPALPSRASIC